MEYKRQLWKKKIFAKIKHETYNFDLQILKTNLQLFAINLLNIGVGLK